MSYSQDFLEEALNYVERELLEYLVLTCKNREMPLFLTKILVQNISEQIDLGKD